MLIKRILLLLLIGVLPSCSFFKYPIDAKQFSQHKKRNLELQKWVSHINITTIYDDRNYLVAERDYILGKSHYFYNYVWVQEDDLTTIYFLFANNKVLFKVSGNAQKSFFQLAHQKTNEGSTLDGNINQEFSKLIGSDFPLNDLVYWLRGLPNPLSVDQTVISIASDNKIRRIKQNGWQVTYQDYQKVDNSLKMTYQDYQKLQKLQNLETYFLPKKINLKSLADPNLEYIFDIEEWIPL